MRVLMVPTTNSGTAYMRMYNYWAAAHRTGVMDVHLLWWQKGLDTAHPWQWDCVRPITRHAITKELQDWARKADVIVVQMVHSYEALALLRALRDMLPHTPIVAECDDNMLSLPAYNEASQQYGPGSVFREFCLAQFREADAMITTTPYLQEDVYADINQHIYVVPNAIDFQIWGKVKPAAKGGIRIIYTAGGNHDEDIRLMEPVIPRIMEKHPEVQFIFFHHAPEPIASMRGVRVLKKWSRIDKYPQAIASLGGDIGIAPLVDNAFNRSKSNLRWLEYSALKLPTVASRVGYFAQTLKDGQDGFMADSPKQFEDCLDVLIEDRMARKNMGLRAYQRVYADFNVDKVTEHYAACLDEIIQRGPQQAPAPDAEGYVAKGLIPAGVPLDEAGDPIQ